MPPCPSYGPVVTAGPITTVRRTAPPAGSGAKPMDKMAAGHRSVSRGGVRVRLRGSIPNRVARFPQPRWLSAHPRSELGGCRLPRRYDRRQGSIDIVETARLMAKQCYANSRFLGSEQLALARPLQWQFQLRRQTW